MNRLVLLDGNALLHRSYHALPPLTSPDGKPTGAVYGFVSMLIRLQIDLNTKYFAVAFDRPKPTFRNELFKEYQAQRPPMDEELVVQIGTVHDVLKVMKIPVFEQDGFEADDVIGTLVRELTHHNNSSNNPIDQIIVVTGDRDILQLVVDDKVLLYMPVKGLSEAKLYGVKEVVERLGVEPQKIPEWKALCGDPSDNYPGVEGIGPKTAADLVNRFQTIEILYTAIEEGNDGLSEKLREKLLRGKESAFLSKTLATIRKDAPVAIDESAFYVPTFNTQEVLHNLMSLGFPSLVKRLQKQPLAEGKEAASEEKKEQKKDNNQLDLFSS